MTNAIEQAKQSMYKWLEAAKKTAHCSEHSISMKWMEECLEAYLEELRLDHEALHVTARERFDSIQLLERANQELQLKNDAQRQIIEAAGGTNDLQYRLAAMTKERDEIQGRLHAVDHAYSVQQQATGVAGGELRAMQDQIGHLTRTRDLAERLAAYRLKQLDGTLQELAALRKSPAGTSAKVSEENVSSEVSGASLALRYREQLSKLQDSQRKVREQDQSHRAKADQINLLSQQAIMLSMGPIQAWLAETIAEINALK